MKGEGDKELVGERGTRKEADRKNNGPFESPADPTGIPAVPPQQKPHLSW